MKKTYSAPEILFEDFALSSSITVGCEFKANHAEGFCSYDTRGGKTFLEAIEACEYKVEDVDDSLCYHVPTTSTNIFTS